MFLFIGVLVNQFFCFSFTYLLQDFGEVILSIPLYEFVKICDGLPNYATVAVLVSVLPVFVLTDVQAVLVKFLWHAVVILSAGTLLYNLLLTEKPDNDSVKGGYVVSAPYCSYNVLQIFASSYPRNGIRDGNNNIRWRCSRRRNYAVLMQLSIVLLISNLSEIK